MAHTKSTERRLLTTTELEFVDKTHHPALAELNHDELMIVVHNLRERRDRAQSIARDQRRSLRGKGGRGAVTFEKADSGNRQKAAVLTDALGRARRELKRRKTQEAREDLIANAHRALGLKRAAGNPMRPDAGDRPGLGMKAKPKTKARRFGSRSGEVGRVTKFVATAQARRDSRGD